MRKYSIPTALTVLLALAYGCAESRAQDPRPIARDVVCAYNGDLGCIDVRVDKDTPRAIHDGKTYYFCSEKCRLDFKSDPKKYLKKR